MLEENQAAVMIGAGVLILLSIILAVIRMSGGGASLATDSTVIYYDLDQKIISLVDHDLSAGPAPSPRAGTENAFIAVL